MRLLRSVRKMWNEVAQFVRNRDYGGVAVGSGGPLIVGVRVISAFDCGAP